MGFTLGQPVNWKERDAADFNLFLKSNNWVVFQVDCFWFQLLCVSDFLEAFLADCTFPQSTHISILFRLSGTRVSYNKMTFCKQKLSKTKCSFPELSYKVGPWSRPQGLIVCVISNRACASRSSSLIVLHSVHLVLLTISRNSVFPEPRHNSGAKVVSFRLLLLQFNSRHLEPIILTLGSSKKELIS